MTKAKQKRRRGPGLGTMVIGIVVGVVLLMAVIAWLTTTLVGERVARRASRSLVTGGLSGHTAFQQHRYRQLQLISRVFATDPVLTGYLAAAAANRDAVKVLDLAEAYQNLLTFDLAIVLDAAGTAVARTDRPEARGEDLSQRPLVAEALSEDRAFGVWTDGGSLYHAAVIPLVRDFDKVGHVLVALRIDDALATQLQRASGVDVVYLGLGDAGPQRVAGTLGLPATSEMIAALRAEGDALQRVSARGETVDGLEVTLASGARVAALTPLRNAAEAPVGLAVALVDPAASRAGYDLIRLAQLAGALVAAILGIALATWLARRTAAPSRRLAEAVAVVGDGQLDAPLPTALGADLDGVASVVGRLAGEVQGRDSVDRVMVEVSRRLPEPGQEATQRARADATVLLAVELAGFAHAKVAYDPEESVSRFGRDLRRVVHAVEGQQGRVAGVSGHRVTARFDGEDAGTRSLAAAASAVRALSERENVFDDPEPPRVAIATGQVVSGTIAWGGGTELAQVGLPLMQLDSLLREATAGEIYLAKPVYEAIAPTLAGAGVTVTPRRGVVSPQPLYPISADEAAKAVALPAGPIAPEKEGRRALTDVTVGTILGTRFEVLARVGAGPRGIVFRTRDRERERFVGLKLLRPEVVAVPERLEQWTSRIRVVRGIDHPSVVGVWDVGQVDGLTYVMTDAVRATNLRLILEALGRLPTASVIRLGCQIAGGVAAAHAVRVAHFGLKPENVLVDAAGRARIADLGLAVPGDPQTPAEASYRAPEQLQLLTAPGPTADVWAIGALLYAMACGRPPYGASSLAEIQAQHQQGAAEPINSLVELPADLTAIIGRCLERDPEARFPTAEPLLEALQAVR